MKKSGFEEIILAATTLASKKIGALIVVERDIGLRNYAESGIALDAVLTYDLLVTIFSPNTPLHDGAVIVQQNRIIAAGCFLPLTLEPHLSKELGTRHRAAIGITEETDAVAVIVSEETGIISAAVGGTDHAQPGRHRPARHSAQRHGKPLGAHSRFHGRTAGSRMSERVRDLFLENWSLKLAALAIACFLWFVVRGDSGAERVITVPLEVQIPRNMEITNERPSTVDVTIRGPAGTMWFGQAIPVCTVDLQEAEEGEHVLPLSERNVQMPRGLDMIAIRPARVRLVLERTTSKEVSVRALLGDPPPEMDIYSVSLNPSKVVITGPRSHVQGVREVNTESVPLTGQREAFRTFVNLNIRDTAIHSTPVGPIEVAVELGPHRTVQTVSRIPVAVDDASVLVSPAQISISVLAPPSLAGNLKPEDFVATVTARALDQAKRLARVKPDVKLKEPRDPAVVVKSVPEVTLHRGTKPR